MSFSFGWHCASFVSVLAQKPTFHCAFTIVDVALDWERLSIKRICVFYTYQNQKIDENVEAEVDDEEEMKKLMEIVLDDELAIDAIPLATNSPIIVD
ncbi:hypothetical protein Tco_0732205 [Tanacetum coccineum]